MSRVVPSMSGRYKTHLVLMYESRKYLGKPISQDFSQS